MSEQPTAPPAARQAPRQGGSFLTRRSGPFKLPNWEWIGFAIAILVVLFVILRQKKKGASQAQGNAAGVQCPQGYAPDSQGNCVPVSTSSNAVPQFVNQTYQTLTAPEQETINVPPAGPGTPGPAGPAGPPGPPGPGGPPGSPPPTSPPPKIPVGQGIGVWSGLPGGMSYVQNLNTGPNAGIPTGRYPASPWTPRYPATWQTGATGQTAKPGQYVPVNGGVF